MKKIKISGYKALIIIGKHIEFKDLDLSGFFIDAEWEKWDKEKSYNIGFRFPSEGIDMGPCKIIPIIIPWKILKRLNKKKEIER